MAVGLNSQAHRVTEGPVRASRVIINAEAGQAVNPAEAVEYMQQSLENQECAFAESSCWHA